MSKIFKTAFTLIELLVVIAIIGILSGLIIVGMSSSINSANIAKSQIFSASIRDSLLANLVSEWKLDGNGNDTWASYNATWYGAGGGTTTVNYRPNSECIYNQCLNFDGTDDGMSATINSSFISGSSYNISFWINSHIFGYPPSACGNKNAFLLQWGYIPSSSGGFSLSEDISGSFASIALNGQLPYGDTNRWNTLTNAFKKLDTWYFFSVNYDINTRKIHYYIDGNGPYAGTHFTLGSDPDYYPLDVSSSTAFYIGGNSNNKSCGSGYFNGKLDEIRIYNGSMNSSKIKEVYWSGMINLLSENKIKINDYQSKIKDFISESLKNNYGSN